MNTALLRSHATYDWFSLRIEVPGRVINIPTLIRKPDEMSADAADRALTDEGFRRTERWKPDMTGATCTAAIELLTADEETTP